MSTAQEGHNAAAEAVGRGLPVYVSWTLEEEPGAGLRSGETIEEAFGAVADLGLDGYLFNCTDPDAIEDGLRTLTKLTERPIGGYPNRYRVPDNWVLGEKMGERPLTTQKFVDAALRAFDIGATIYGGCCTVGPEDIAALAKAVEKA
jgi:homocysteine S-methyltransferase